MLFSEFFGANQRINILQNNDLITIHKKAIAQLGSNVTDAQCQKIETFLNSAFYPDGGKNDYAQAIQQMITQAYERVLGKKLSEFQGMQQSSVSVVEEGVLKKWQIIQEQYEQTKHKNYIERKTLQTRLEKLQQSLMELANNPELVIEASDQISDYERRVDELASNINIILKKYTDEKIDISKDADLYKKINELDKEFMALSYAIYLTPQDLGNILEWVLQAFSGIQEERFINNFLGTIEKDMTEVVEQKFKTSIMKTAGSQSRKLEDVTFSIEPNIEVDEKFSQQNQDLLKQNIFQLNGENGKPIMTFDISSDNFDPTSNRQGKADVLFDYYDDSTKEYTPFRFSAKNWSTLTGNFGETNVIYALLRSLGMDKTEQYVYSFVLPKLTDNKLQAMGIAHKLAKYGILIDVLMGYSQKEGYADTLVINVRNGDKPCVKVFSIKSILDKICKALQNETNTTEKFYVRNYEPIKIESNMLAIYNILGQTNRSETYKFLTFKYLQSIKTTITWAAIKDYVPKSVET